MNTARQQQTQQAAVVNQETAIKVYQAINAVQSDLSQTGIGKTQQNTQQRYNFRGIDDLYNALAPSLARNNLVIVPQMLERVVTEKPTRNGAMMSHVVVKVQYDFISSVDGSTHSIVMYGEAMDSADKATNKAFTAAYKYAAFQVFCIPTSGDNDADRNTHEIRNPQYNQQRPNQNNYQRQQPQQNHQQQNHQQQVTNERQNMANQVVDRYQQKQQVRRDQIQQNKENYQAADNLQRPNNQRKGWDTRSEVGPTTEQLQAVAQQERQQAQEQEQAQQPQREPVIVPHQVKEIRQALNNSGIEDAEERFCRAANIKTIGALQQRRFSNSMEWIQRKAMQ